MRKYCLFVCLLFSVKCFCQYKIHFIVTDNAMYKATKMFAAGNFNSWQPADKNYQFTKKENNNWELTLSNFAKAAYSVKFTQGSWQTVEYAINGGDRENRQITINSDTTFYFTTIGWGMEDKPRNHTSSKNVHIISDSFFMPQLNRKRKIWIYLPSNYANSKEKYPVLYMHDAQNLFDEFTAPYGEWGVDEALDSLQKRTSKYAIVVGVDHGDAKRLVEYNPYDTKEYGKGEGEAYTDFLVQTLKPYVDNNYRTKKDAAHTSVAGSSLGGLISTYAILKYPNIFGSAGIFSPAYWIAPALQKLVKQANKKHFANKLWFYGGEKEGYTMMEDMERIKNLLPKNVELVLLKVKDGEHNEKAWRNIFPLFYTWWIAK